tara:strand:- start:473 stop:646 length:174 start_codon:yes stop_codon:yes gene_type:complete
MEKAKVILLTLVLVSGCTATNHTSTNTWIMPTVETHPEERYVADKAPVIPVEIKKLD